MDNQIFYVVSPDRLTFPFVEMSLQQRRDVLTSLIEMHGSRWATVRLPRRDFRRILEKVDNSVRAGEDFLHAAFENSPRKMLPIGSTGDYDPLLGYFEPDRVREFDQKLRRIGTTALSTEHEYLGDAAAQVMYAFRSTFAEAARRGCAVAVEHR